MSYSYKIRGEECFFLKTKQFPLKLKYADMNHRALLGIGGNIGKVISLFEKLFLYLQKNSNINIYKSSYIYKNPPFGYKNQPYFYNALLWVETNLSLLKFFSYMMYIERRFGRVKNFKDGPRVIDIDIIFFDRVRVQREWLNIPHKEWRGRDSILAPMYFEGF